MIARLWYEVRWWRWFLFYGKRPVGWNMEESHEERQARAALWWANKLLAEPQFRGTYPHRKLH